MWTSTFTTTATAYGMNYRAIITFPAWYYPPKKKNDISAYGDIDIYGGDLSMRKRKYYLYLTAEERRYIFNALLSYRNKRIAQGRYTDAVDEVMIKLQK